MASGPLLSQTHAPEKAPLFVQLARHHWAGKMPGHCRSGALSRQLIPHDLDSSVLHLQICCSGFGPNLTLKHHRKLVANVDPVSDGLQADELNNKYLKISEEEAQEGWEGVYESSFKSCMHGPGCQQGPDCQVQIPGSFYQCKPQSYHLVFKQPGQESQKLFKAQSQQICRVHSWNCLSEQRPVPCSRAGTF